MRSAILGLSAFYHDSAAALLLDGRIVAAAQEERFSRRKHDPSFPNQAARYVLSEAGLKVSDLTAIAFYDKPLLKFERLLETYYAFAPRGLKSFLAAIPVWVKEKLFMRRMLWQALAALDDGHLSRRPPLLFTEHHLSHAASAFYPSPFNEAAILTLDGVGEWATSTIGYGEGNQVTLLRELHFPHSLGLLYAAFTSYCGFKVNSGEYKLMGLAPYGDPTGERCQRYRQLILDHLVDLRPDGSFLLNMDYFAYATDLHMCRDEKWEPLFGLPRRVPESEITPPYMDMALAIQQVTEDIVLRLARTTKALTRSSNLVLAGGVALNCVANSALWRSGEFERLWIQPAAGDAGGALGAAYAVFHLWQSQPRTTPAECFDQMQGAYLGPEFGTPDVKRLAEKYRASYKTYADFDWLCRDVAERLAEGQVVGWFQGRMEWGPRALGNRSILADPTRPEMQKKLNLKIKEREAFRPFAPSVLAEETQTYFDLDIASPYMLFVAPVKEARRTASPPSADPEIDMYERLYHLRSDMPAITHVDYSARLQTVHQETNERYWKLIRAFQARTGYGLVVNTSFNVRGEPIVCSPEDAYRCFMRTEMDWLVIGDYLFDKREQPAWEEAREQTELD